MKYDPMMIEPMRQELNLVGAEQLTTAEKLETFLSDNTGTVLMFVNSVCGCAAGSARPGLTQSMQSEVRPDKVGSVFAGQDVEATAALRGRFPDYPPSSPCIALFKNGEVVHFVPRHMIEGREAAQVSDDLVTAYQQHCGS